MLGAMNFSMPVGESEVVYSSVGDGVLKRGVIVKHRCERERRGDRGARGKVPVSSKGRIRRQEEWRLLACFWGEMRRARRYESAHLLLARLLAKAWPPNLGLSAQFWHVPQSSRVHGMHCPHLCSEFSAKLRTTVNRRNRFSNCSSSCMPGRGERGSRAQPVFSGVWHLAAWAVHARAATFASKCSSTRGRGGAYSCFSRPS